MAVPKTLTWDKDAHTGAKHQLLRNYLQAWTPILARWNQSLTYAEGFAGPGIYKDGDPGSPIVAMNVFGSDLAARPSNTVRMVLIEEDPQRLNHLRERVAIAATTLGSNANRIPVTFQQGRCGDHLIPALASVRAFDSPIFAFFDSWGSPTIPFELISRIAATPRSEVLLTFQPSFLVRHGQKPNHRDAGDRAFGGTHWQGVFEQDPDQKYPYLITAYRKSLELAGFEHSLSFEMVDEGNRPLALLFGTNGVRGIEKMKDAMWQVDQVQGVRYRDQRDPAQTLLDLHIEPHTGPLRSMLLEHLKSHPEGCSLDELRDWAVLETVYKRSQVTGVVRALRDAGRVETTPGRIGPATIVSISTKPKPTDELKLW